MADILRRGHGGQLDHLGIGVPDTEDWAGRFETMTGATVHVGEPEPDQFYWSASLPISADSYIELVGPNPDYRGDLPNFEYLKQLTQPSIDFWYIATDDIDGLAIEAEAVGGLIENVDWVNRGGLEPRRSGYGRAILGPGWIPQRPCIIQWDHQVSRHGDAAPECAIASFELFHPTAAESNRLLEDLGIEARLSPGPSRFRLVLDTPNGELVFDNPGFDAPG
ncbi:MAG: VOC family protein [Actinomycetota bacterium]